MCALFCAIEIVNGCKRNAKEMQKKKLAVFEFGLFLVCYWTISFGFVDIWKATTTTCKAISKFPFDGRVSIEEA
jgi:hypothetical protein